MSSNHRSENRTIHSITDFFYALDELKLVNRKSYVTGSARYENSAEHSWH